MNNPGGHQEDTNGRIEPALLDNRPHFPGPQRVERVWAHHQEQRGKDCGGESDADNDHHDAKTDLVCVLFCVL
jgi:hypothetical protein